MPFSVLKHGLYCHMLSASAGKKLVSYTELCMQKSGAAHCSHKIPVNDCTRVDIDSLPRIYLGCAAVLEKPFLNICILTF